MKNWRLITVSLLLGFPLIFAGAWAITELANRSVDAALFLVKRTAVIEELDKGFLVICNQKENPYPYRRAAAETGAEASQAALLCFQAKAGWPEDRVRRK
jgi:hypothetical protein